MVQQNVSKFIDGKFPTSLIEAQEEIYDEFTYTSIILYLSDTVLKKVGKFDSTEKLWKKFDDLYVLKFTTNK